MRRISIFGATGSIGQNTIDLIADGDGFAVEVLTGGRNVAQLASDAKALQADIAVTCYPDCYADLKAAGIKESEVHAEVQRYFNHKQKLSGFSNPLLILHTENDGLIDISHAERNHEWAGSGQKQLVRFPNGNHNTILRANLTEYLATVGNFVNSVQS